MLKRAFVAVLLACALAACGDDDSTGPDDTPASLAGRYILVSVDGDTLPVLLRDDSVRVVITAGQYSLNMDDTFTFSFTYNVTRNGATAPQTISGLGQWFQNKDAVWFDYGEEEFPDAATVSGRFMYMTVLVASPYVFRRE
jgi:hypothetical protein